MVFLFLRLTATFAFLNLLCLAAPTPAQAQQPAKASEPLLKPFLPATPSTDAKAAQVLIGRWQGTFKHKNQEGVTSESTYLVEVGPGLRTLKVSRILLKTGSPTNEPIAADVLEPTIDTQPVVWDGTMLRVHSREDHSQPGNATAGIDKRIALGLGRDNKHALFTYEIRLTSVSGSGSVTTTMQGSGVLSRRR